MATTVEPYRLTALNDVTLTCYRCQCEFQVPRELYRVRKIDHQSFWCPLGHEQHFPEGPTEAERLRQQLDAERARVEFWRAAERRESTNRKAAERRAAAARGQVTKIKNRVAGGVCPCCSRSFVQLARHMATKHPDFTEQTQAAR